MTSASLSAQVQNTLDMALSSCRNIARKIQVIIFRKNNYEKLISLAYKTKIRADNG
jgi:hypothetical protein